MLVIHDYEHFQMVLEFASQNDCLPKLLQRLEYLAMFADGRCDCHLYRDWAPLSFAFMLMKPNEAQEKWFNGGLIYSGPGQPLDGSGPAFTVSVAPVEPGHNWSVHT